jgi:hypothetical protein
MPDKTPDLIPDNPIGADFAKLADDGKRYRTTTNILAHRTGVVVSAKDLGPGAQVQRLIDDGAIVPVSDEEARAMTQTAADADAARFDPAASTGGEGGHTIALRQEEAAAAGKAPEPGSPDAVGGLAAQTVPGKEDPAKAKAVAGGSAGATAQKVEPPAGDAARPTATKK